MERNLHRYIINRSLKPQLVLIAISFVLGLGLNPLMLDLQKRIINQAIGRRNFEALLWLCGGFLGAVILNGALKYVKQNLEGYISETMLRDLRGELYNRILRFPLLHLKNTSTAQMVAMILGEVEDLGGYFGLALSTPAFHGAMLLGTLGYMVYANPWMALVSMVLFPIQIVFIRRLQRKVTAMSRDRVRLVRGLSDRIQESVGGLQEIYANDTAAYESGRFRHQLQRIFKIRLNIYNLKYLIKWINNFLEKFGQFLLLLVGGWLIIHHPESFNLGILVAFLQAYSQLNEPWRELINFFQLKENARVKYEQVIANFDPPGLRNEFARDDASPERPPALGGAYDLRQASVVLDGRTHALDHLQLTLSPRQHIAVVGTAGSGKSTLALVLAKLSGYTGTILLDGVDLTQLSPGHAGRAIGFVPADARLFTGSVLDNLLYGLRHRRAEQRARDADLGLGGEDWLDLSPLEVSDRTGLVAVALETVRLVGLEDDLFGFGLRSRVDPARHPDVAERIVATRRLVAARFAGEGQETAVEFFDRDRFSSYASIGENILFGHSSRAELGLEQLPQHPHFRAVIAEVGLQEPLVELGADVARDMVEIFTDIAADNELFARFSLLTASELPEYAQVVARVGRGGDLTEADRDRLIRLALRLIPARHRLGRIDEAFIGKVLAARRRFAEALPPELSASFVPYDRERYFADGTLLDNLLFGKVVATSSLAVKKVNAIVEEILEAEDLRGLVLEVGLDHHVGLFGGRLSLPQRQRMALARVLLKRPDILILDGAMAALEPGERMDLHRRVLESMKDRTVIAAVERPDLARLYDRVVVLDAGAVAEAGTYQELVAQEQGVLRRIAAQAGVRVTGED
ncbi:MAG TPA: ABC transporter ATP-binding protein [Methylomirabilota bacterium]